MSDPKVLYNGGCPVCAGGMNAYRGATRDPETCSFVDVRQTPEALAAHGLTLKDVMYRVHFVEEDGRLLRGMPAIATLWQRDRRFYPLSRVVRLPVLNWLATGLYELIAAPLYVWNLWREKRRANVSPVDRRP